MPWLNMYYQVIWPGKYLLDGFDETKNVRLAYIDGHYTPTPNVGFSKKPVTRCVLKIKRLVLVWTPHTGMK